MELRGQGGRGTAVEGERLVASRPAVVVVASASDAAFLFVISSRSIQNGDKLGQGFVSMERESK